MILGYAGDFSVEPGGKLALHLASDGTATHVRLSFYRSGAAGWEHVATSDERLQVEPRPLGAHDASWRWPAFEWTVPSSWRSGVYAALALPDGGEHGATDPEARRLESILFVVRAPLQSRVLYKLPIFTYAAYASGELGAHDRRPTSLYQDGVERVTLFRPGIGTDPWDWAFVDHEDRSSPRQTFAHWDAKMIAWLEQRGHRIDYCTDLDIHRGLVNLDHYDLLLSVGHDEYWSAEMRARVEAFIEAGGSAAFFSANTAWWRTTLAESAGEALLARHDHWAPDDLETRLTGVSYRHGSGCWNGPRREAIGYRVQHCGHWAFEGTGLDDGDVIAAEERLVGYECDGAALRPPTAGRPREPSFVDGTPPSFVVLGWAETPAWDEPEHAHEPTMGVYTRGGTVFTAGTTDWPRVLVGGDAAVTRITENVLARLTELGSRRRMG